jgi:hypothetical protein
MMILAVVFLGLIALSSLIQAVFLIGVAREGKELSKRLLAIEHRFETEIRPTLQNLSRMSHNFAEVSELIGLQARRVDLFMADTVEKLEQASTSLRDIVLRPLGPLVDIAALLKGFRKGMEIYRRLGGIDSERKGAARRYQDDEHLFI